MSKISKDQQRPLESLKKGVNGLVCQDLGDDWVSGHAGHKLSLGQLVVLVPENSCVSSSSFCGSHLVLCVWDPYWSPLWNISAITVAMSTLPESAPARRCRQKLPMDGGGKMFTNLDEERHHVEELVNADGAVAVLVEEIEDAEQVVLGLAVAEQVEQHAHAVER